MMPTEPTSEITARSIAVVGAVAIGVALSGAQFATTAISVFIGQIATDYGWSRAQISGAVTMLYFGMAISAPLFGVATDRYGPRLILLPLTLLSGLLISIFSMTGASLLIFYAAHLLLGVAQPGLVTYNKMISTWFWRRRAIALSAVGIGTVISQIGVPPLARFLLDHLGWHRAYILFGAAELLIAFPVLMAFFRGPKIASLPTEAAGRSAVQSGDGPHIGIGRAMRSRRYWHLIAIQVCVMFAFLSVTTHAVGILADRGVDAATAVWGLSTFAVGGFAAQLVTGHLLDRYDTPRIIAPFALLSVLSLVLLQLGAGEKLMLAAMFFFGFGCTGCGPISYFTTRYFGVRSFSTILGSIFPIMMLLSAGSPVIFGTVFDHTGSYLLAISLSEVAMVGALVMILLLAPYPDLVEDRTRAAVRHKMNFEMSRERTSALGRG